MSDCWLCCSCCRAAQCRICRLIGPRNVLPLVRIGLYDVQSRKERSDTVKTRLEIGHLTRKLANGVLRVYCRLTSGLTGMPMPLNNSLTSSMALFSTRLRKMRTCRLSGRACM